METPTAREIAYRIVSRHRESLLPGGSVGKLVDAIARAITEARNLNRTGDAQGNVSHDSRNTTPAPAP